MQENKFKCYMWHQYKEDSYNPHSFYKNMFIEDIRAGILPIKLSRNKDSTKVIIEGNESNSEIFKTILNSFNRRYETNSIEKLVKYTIESIATDISWNGKAMYEIYQTDKNISFINLFSDKFIDLKFFYIQIPPKKSNFPYKIINKKHIWEISIPKKLEKKYSYKKILSSIDKFDSLMPKPFKERLDNGDISSLNYNRKEYREKQYLYVNNLTSDWGWNQRITIDDITTEFFNNYKYLKFKLSQAIFREHIINELNILFKKFNLDISIKIEGIATSKDCENQIEKYKKNEISFESIFNLDYED